MEEILAANRPFRFGTYLSKGFELYGKNVGNFVAFSMLSVFIMSAVGSLPVIGSLSMRYLLVPALTAGFYIVSNQLDRGERSDFGDHFLGFQHLVRLGLAAVAVSVISIMATIPFFLANYDLIGWSWTIGEAAESFDFEGIVETFPGFSAWTFLLLLPLLYLGVAYAWTSLFIIFHNLNAWQAMEASRRLITKNWIPVFLFLITIGLIGVGGIVGFLIGIFFTYPLMLCINYAAFADLTQLETIEKEEEYVDILVK